jgi:hypothetical protein
VSGILADPAELADLGQERIELAEAWVSWAFQNGFRADTFVTPTFDEARLGYVSPERATQAWRWAVRHVSEGMYGAHYRRWCKHAPFSYLVGVDYSKLGAVHLHAVIHGWVDYRLLIVLWKRAFGRIDIEQLDQGSVEQERVALAHVTKYAMKGSDLVCWWFRSGDPDLARLRPGKRSRRQEPPASGSPARAVGTRQAQPLLPGMGGSAQHLAGGLIACDEGLTGTGPR